MGFSIEDKPKVAENRPLYKPDPRKQMTKLERTFLDDLRKTFNSKMNNLKPAPQMANGVMVPKNKAPIA